MGAIKTEMRKCESAAKGNSKVNIGPPCAFIRIFGAEYWRKVKKYYEDEN
jgi:hypothetical protein